jgi:hypothetical protein
MTMYRRRIGMAPKGIVPVLRTPAEAGLQDAALGDPGHRGERRAKAGEMLCITVEAISCRLSWPSNGTNSRLSADSRRR